jgi:sugar phosphate isomerase/epimerase
MDRRQFLRDSGTGLAALALASAWKREMMATPLGKPIGLMQFTVRDDMAKDLEGTLAKIAEIGYREIELFDFYNKTAAEIRRLLSAHGLACPSALYLPSALKSDWERQISYATDVGIRFMGCAVLDEEHRSSLDGYRQAAELFNRCGAQCQKAGIQFFYHNHNFEFKVLDGVVPYDELLRRSDPKLVAFELDCFWATRAGKDPVAYITGHPGRYPLLHIKDLKPGFAPATLPGERNAFTEVGRGIIDWKRVFAAAGKSGLQHYFVEQDVCERPPLESIRISYEYLKSLKV